MNKHKLIIQNSILDINTLNGLIAINKYTDITVSNNVIVVKDTKPFKCILCNQSLSTHDFISITYSKWTKPVLLHPKCGYTLIHKLLPKVVVEEL